MPTQQIGWYGVDLDGTLAFYDGWKGDEHIGKPIKPMVAKVIKLLRHGEHVKIFTARAGHGLEAIKYIDYWCMATFGVKLEVTNVKDFDMIELWDDRCRQVVQNEGEFVISDEGEDA
jgi:hypothetical protein